MIIRHDLQLLFLHVPKCAGKEVRQLFERNAAPGQCESLFNYRYCPVLQRQVDMAHQPLADLAHQPEFDLLERYRSVACIRSPYERLISAISEYHRQHSKAMEQRVQHNRLRRRHGLAYLRALLTGISSRDPRFVHALPISSFTHYGTEPKVDVLLRCEQLSSDLASAAASGQLPQAIAAASTGALRQNVPLQLAQHPCRDEVIALANLLYVEDFLSFGYTMLPTPEQLDRPIRRQLEALGQIQQSHSQPFIHLTPLVQWHWGPSSVRPEPHALAPTRAQPIGR
jgi:hypothetical protein